jgi:cell division transport system permease protein
MTGNGGYMVMRGVSLFIKYISENILSILALTALFTAFHIIFLAGGALRDFTETAVRFDTMRVYAQDFPDQMMDKISSAAGVEAVEKVYSPSDTKAYISSSAASPSALDALPAEFFPAFAEIKIKPEYRDIDSLKHLSEELSAVNGVESVSFGEKWMEELGKLRLSVEAVLAICAAIFTAAGCVIIYQTVSVTLFRYRREVRIYAVVGGTRAFIIIPFMVVSACICAICFVLSLFIFNFSAGFIRSGLSGVTGIALTQNPHYWEVFAALSLTVSVFAGFFSAKHFLNRRLS